MSLLYINLERSADRRLYMEQQFAQTDITPVRVDAVDYMIPGKLENILKIPQKHNTERKFLAILASHLSAIHTAYKMNVENVIISEDDVDYSFFIREYDTLYPMLDHESSKCDLIQLHSSSPQAIEKLYKPNIRKPPRCITKNLDNITFWGATSYLINISGISKIMKLYNKKKKRFELDGILKHYGYRLKCLSDVLLYVLCESKILTIPLVNIAPPTLLPSTVQADNHVQQLHVAPYLFIKESSALFSKALSSWEKLNIPAIMHHTWKDENIPHVKFNKLLKILHPDWEFKLWTDSAMDAFIFNNYPQYYDKYSSFIMIQKCDFFRYIVVYHYGGFYMDLDIVIYKNLDKLRALELCLFNEKILTNEDCVRCGHPYRESHRVANYAFGSVPKDPFLLRLITGIIANSSKCTRDVDVLNTTGPGYLTKLYHDITPCSLIYPTTKPSTKYTCSCNDWSMCRVGDYGNHLHMGSWRQD